MLWGSSAALNLTTDLALDLALGPGLVGAFTVGALVSGVSGDPA
jgi:hypothetical protein